MRLEEARAAANQQLNILHDRRKTLTQLLDRQEKTGLGNFDRVELSRELETVTESYEETFRERERLNELDAAIQNGENTRQQAELEADAAREELKLLEIFRRIANGDKVPACDEQKLMEHNSKMYMAAKSMAVLHQGEGKEHDSLWEDEEPPEERPDAGELADDTQVVLQLPELPPEGAVPPST